MSAIPATRILSFAAGIFLSGVTFSISAQTLFRHGVSFDIRLERSRQTMANFLCFIGSIFALSSYCLLQTRSSVAGLTAMTFLVFACIHVLLAMLLHNLFLRIAWMSRRSKLDQATFSRQCLPVYILPLVTLIPAYLAIDVTSRESLPMIFSVYHIMVLRPLTFALVALVGLATIITDAFFLRRIRRLYGFLRHESTSARVRPVAGSNQLMMVKVLNRMYFDYATLWIFILSDLVIKSCAMGGVPVLFDNICTLLWITMTCRVNLKYGLTLQKIIQPGLELSTANFWKPETRTAPAPDQREIIIIEPF